MIGVDVGAADAFEETAVSGFTRRDGTIAFYTFVNSLVRPTDTVVDLGAGRGEWLEDPVDYRRNLRLLRGKVSKVVGVDIDPVVVTNKSCDEAVVQADLTSIPIESRSIDVVISDYTLEHVQNPVEFAGEVGRVLRPGGWFCARTPNRWGMIGVATNIIPNRQHTAYLRRLQPSRQAQDVFPTVYGMNTRRRLKELFPPINWDLRLFGHNAEPAYFGSQSATVRAVDVVQSRLPEFASTTWHIFARRIG